MSRRRPGEAAAPGHHPTAPEAEAVAEVSAPTVWRHPALILPFAIAAAVVLLSVTYRIGDPDLWQHLAMGRTIWQRGAVPQTHLWSWPIYGTPAVLPIWGFVALLWPFWKAGGVVGLFAWRWLTALATFGVSWMTARRAGARGLAPLVILVLAALTYRLPVRVGPETLAALLLALMLWALEAHRTRIEPGAMARGLDPAVWVVPILWLWANVHDTWWIGAGVIVIHLIDGVLGALGSRLARRSGAARTRAAGGLRILAIAALAAVAVSLLNPFGWRVLWAPVQELFGAARDVLDQAKPEHQPIVWRAALRSELALLVILWPLFWIWRVFRSRIDWAEGLLMIGFVALLFQERRFAAFTAVAAAPYLARDLDAWIRSIRWPSGTAAPWVRAAFASVACLAIGLFAWTRPGHPVAVEVETDRFPVHAADFMDSNAVRGKGFVPAPLGGYVLWRFGADRERLPFMDTAMKGTREDRETYPYVFNNPSAWKTLDERHRFDYVLMDGRPAPGSGNLLLDFLDADTTYSLVFRDDAAAIYVRRHGPVGRLALRSGYFFAPGGDSRIPLLVRACQADTTLRRIAQVELDRMIRESPENARAHSLQATIAWIDRRPEDARRHLRAALETDPRAEGAHQRLGLMALSESRPDEALREFQAEVAAGHPSGELYLFIGRAQQRLGDRSAARTSYQRALEMDPENAAARDSLAVLDRAEGGASGR